MVETVILARQIKEICDISYRLINVIVVPQRIGRIAKYYQARYRSHYKCLPSVAILDLYSSINDKDKMGHAKNCDKSFIIAYYMRKLD